MTDRRIDEIFKALGMNLPAGGLVVTSPWDGEALASPAEDTARTLADKIAQARTAQRAWKALPRSQREGAIIHYAGAIKAQREALAALIHLEAGKTMKEALAETDSAADTLARTVRDASLPELANMLRTKERAALGLVGLITSFNFPISVAHWTLAPALLARNAVLWKPSEKTPLVALACKAIFDKALPPHAGILQVAIGARAVGEALVADEQVDMVSATGSSAMGQGIKSILAKKTNRACAPILELGGNNGIVVSQHCTAEHLQWAAKAIMASFLGTTGQRCTNTRRLIVHRSHIDGFAGLLKKEIEHFLATAVRAEGLVPDHDSGYGALIDEDAFQRFEKAKAQAVEEGGSVWKGGRLFADKYPKACYVEPALAVMKAQRSERFKDQSVMYKETFGPLLFVAPYEGDIEEGIALLNAPANAGLVGGIYTQSRAEAECFAKLNQAGHGLINSPKGTGTPAYGMGFGGNKDSGEGEILNAADPLAPFTRRGRVRRIAWNKDIEMRE